VTDAVQRSPLEIGKRPLTQDLQRRPSSSAAAPTATVQRRAVAESPSRHEQPPSVAGGFGEAFHDGGRGGAATEEGDVHAIAERGLSGPAAPLPHLARIQASFGRHDVSHVQAHVGGAAAEASAAMGAIAYATGDHIAFADSPDLHTAAHEAAHTVQQRGGVQLRGGVGAAGDDYERHADAVADRVVRGESAEVLLDGAAAGGATGAAVQRKEAGRDTRDDKAGDEPELVKQDGAEWPVFARTGKPYIIEDRGGKPGFWVARDWITAAGDLGRQTDPRTKRTAYVAPSRARELLGAMGWVAADRIEFAAAQLTFEFRGALSHFIVGAEAAFATGLPQGRQAVVDRDGSGGLLVTLALDDEDTAPGSPHQATTSEVTRGFRAAAAYTGLDVDPEGHAFLTGGWVPPVGLAGNGVLALTLNRTVCRTLFGIEAFDAWAGEKKARAEEPKTPKLKLENFFKRPIPGRLTHYGDLVESNESLRLEVLVDWPPNAPDPEMFDAPPMVTPSKFGNVALMSCTWRFERIDGAAVSAPVETQATTVAEATHRFRLASGEATGTFRVTCDARFDEYFAPTTFTRDVVVMSSAATMHKLKSEAFAGLGAPDVDRQKDSWTGDARPGFKGSPLAGAGGYVEDPMARDRDRQRERLQSVADYLRGSPASETAVTALDREIARQTATEHLLAGDRAKGWQTFQVRGTYLSRTEGLASGPLDLHGTVHIERHVDSYAGDGPSTTMHVRNDRTVVRIRDLSRRFEQSDFVFEGEGDTFDEALRHAFDDLAVAYPKGMVSIETEQIRDGALTSPEGVAGPDAANGPGTGKVIGFQRSTETAWKKVKEVVWDPVASIAVNLGAIALMTLVPGSAVIVAPALVAYNSVPSIDHVKTEADRGTLTLGTFAMSTGEVALNLLPLVSRAKPFTAGWYMVETANWGGQVALMSVSAIGAAQQLQATQVAALAQEYEQFLELQKSSLPSDPGLASAEEAIRRKAAALDGEISRQFWSLVEDNVFQMAAGSVIHSTSTHARGAIVERLGMRPATSVAGGDGATPPAGSETVVHPAAPHGDPAILGTGEHPAAPTTGEIATAAPQASLAASAGADRRIRSDGKAGDFFADASDLSDVHQAWASRYADDVVTPIHYDLATNTAHFDIRRNGERIRVTADVARPIMSAGELTSTTNRVVGKPISASEGHNILRALSENRLEALSAVGIDVPAGTEIALGTEFGLGEVAGGKVVVVVGEHAAVDWSHLPGVTPKAHTHPSTPGNDLLRYTGSESMPLTRILEPTKVPLIARELVLPSPPDVALMARLGVDGHRVITPFIVRNGHVMKPEAGDNSPRLEWVIMQPREVGRRADGSTVYEATLVGEVDGNAMVQTKVWSTEPVSSNPGNHFMTAPEMTPTSKPAPGGGRKTPAGGPMPMDPWTHGLDGAQIEHVLQQLGEPLATKMSVGDASFTGSELVKVADSVSRLRMLSNVRGVEDWLAFEETQGPLHLRNAVAELRSAERRATENPAQMFEIGGDKHAPIREGTINARNPGGDPMQSFDMAAREGGSIVKSIEVTSAKRPIKRLTELTDGVRHATDKVASRIDENAPIPGNELELEIRIEMFKGQEQIGTGTVTYDGAGNYTYKVNDGTITPPTFGRNPNPGNIFVDFAKALPTIGGSEKLDVVTLADGAGNVVATFRREGNAWKWQEGPES
jgi:hypothetical protein